MSFPRLADLELLASLSSSQPGLLKCEREEEEEEQEQEGEPDSKKSNTVEEESKGLEKEAGSWKTDVVKAKHRKNCECCPGHHLIINHYSSMS